MKRLGTTKSGVALLAIEARRSGLARTVSRFRRDEDGSLLIFGLFCFVMMLLLAGAALDLMRFEERRTKLQNTVDRAVLAAADLNQTLDAKEVVKDYFRKAGLTPPKDSEIIVQSGNFNEWRTVSADVKEDMPTWFMNMMGIPKLTTPAAGQAEERIGQVEISLVLDVSGSMNSNSRLTNLRPAAKSFIDTMFDSVEPGKLSMNIVTYSTQVSLGPTLASYFNMSSEHSNSDCIEFTPTQYDSTALLLKPTMVLPSTPKYQRNGHFDPFNTVSPPSLLNCPQESERDIVAFSGDRVKLKDYVDDLIATGNTSIDVGMKWGAALLDPSLQPVVDSYIQNGRSPSEFSDRPYAYRSPSTPTNMNSMKVIVVMTDGSNTTEYMLNPNYREGNSIIHGNTNYAASDPAGYSVWDATRQQFYLISKSTWRNEPWGDGQITTCSGSRCTTTQDPGDSVPLTWQEVWERMSINFVADKLIAKPYGTTVRNQWRSGGNTVVSRMSPTTTPVDKDDLTRNICTAAKNKDVTIFAIGFEAPTAGINLLKQCASTPSNYYNAAGTNISTAFSAIASSINKLRLTN
jgi:Flp pilus assembly protein TadG